jgi:hypothetical protein
VAADTINQNCGTAQAAKLLSTILPIRLAVSVALADEVNNRAAAPQRMLIEEDSYPNFQFSAMVGPQSMAFVRRIAVRARYVLSDILDQARRAWSPVPILRSCRQMDAAMLENRVVLSASPISARLVEPETAVPSHEAPVTFVNNSSFHSGHESAVNDVGRQLGSDRWNGDELTIPRHEIAGGILLEPRHSRELVFVDPETKDYQRLIDELLHRSNPAREFRFFFCCTPTATG